MYTREQLEGMQRLVLRRIAKEKGLTGTEIANMNTQTLIDTVLELQEEGENTKETKQERAMKEKGRGRGRPPKANKEETPKSEGRRPGRPRKAQEEEDIEETEEVVEPRRSLKKSRRSSESSADTENNVKQQIDELGKVYNVNHAELLEKVDDLSANVDIAKSLIAKLLLGLHAEQVIEIDEEGMSLLEDIDQENNPND